jgi:hypothetical protein
VSLVFKNGSEAMLLNYAGPTYTNHPELTQAYVAFAANGTVQVTVVSVSLLTCVVPTHVVMCYVVFRLIWSMLTMASKATLLRWLLGEWLATTTLLS